MELQTTIPLQKESRNLIDYHSNILLMGSCFSENMGNQLSYFKFPSTQNPFGILFHPKAIENLILKGINEEEFHEEDLLYHNDRWHCFEVHSNLSSGASEKILKNLNSAISITKKSIQEASHIIITLGTSWVYRLIESDQIVANCHKVPQRKFLKELLTVDEVLESLHSIIALLKSVNKDVNILFTVSPVRHLKDGFIENTQSKSHLISAIHSAVDKRRNIFYFPSYELMMDELRDYRFYKEDMIHPNNIAIKYIWEKFVATWFSESAIPIMKEVASIQKGMAHKPFDVTSEKHQLFLEKLKKKKGSLTKKLPFIQF